jgi:hypothetical protein
LIDEFSGGLNFFQDELNQLRKCQSVKVNDLAINYLSRAAFY